MSKVLMEDLERAGRNFAKLTSLFANFRNAMKSELNNRAGIQLLHPIDLPDLMLCEFCGRRFVFRFSTHQLMHGEPVGKITSNIDGEENAIAVLIFDLDGNCEIEGTPPTTVNKLVEDVTFVFHSLVEDAVQ